MSTNVNLFEITFAAVRGIGQYRVVTQGAADFSVNYGDPAQVLGVSQRDVNSGQSAQVQLFGITRVLVGAAVTRGAPLVAQSGTGFAIAGVASGGAGQTAAVFGRALTSAASGMLASVFVHGPVFASASGAAV